MHAIILYAIGGGLDLYDYPNGIPGTAVATKELSALPGEGPSNYVYQCYELVMFTRHPLDLDAAEDEDTAFGRRTRSSTRSSTGSPRTAPRPPSTRTRRASSRPTCRPSAAGA